jgi:type II secretory pathway pseudopilin PulG
MRPRGATLIELLISMSMFLLILATVFLLFGIASRGFRTVESRQLAQNQLAAIRASLQTDLQVSHFYGVRVDTSTSFLLKGVEQPRHALSAVALEDWDNRDTYGVPIWDRWVAYRVSNEEKGQLLRHVVLPPAGQTGRALLRPADGLAMLAATVAPYNSAWANISPPLVLARGLRSLQAKLDNEQRAVELSVTIEQKAEGQSAKSDVLTATFYIKPHNTVPTD